MILVYSPGSWQHLYPPLAHAPWHGLTPTDRVFPFFLFAVGASMAFTLPSMGVGFWPKVARRTGLVVAIGLALNAAPFVRARRVFSAGAVDTAAPMVRALVSASCGRCDFAHPGF